MLFDRRDDWWGAKAGFRPLPAPERIVLVPSISDDAAAQLYIGNRLDSGIALQAGTFSAARARNPKLRSWNAQGPVWGAPDGCGYTFLFNNAKEPWSNRDVRLAINYAINRQEISTIAYENSNYPIVVPFSGYMSSRWLTGSMKEIVDKHNRNNPSRALVDQHMQAAGYQKNGQGIWEKGGQTLRVPVRGSPAFVPLSPVLTAQLKRAGFEAVEQVEPSGSTAWQQDLTAGSHDTVYYVHCGSLSEPFDTFKDLHSKFAAPIGEKCPIIQACTRYRNPELDKILDQMEAQPKGQPNNPQYVELAAKALEIYLQDMPEVMLTEELWVITFNEAYWTGWPNAENPYVAPYPPWEAWNLIVHTIKPTQ